MSKSGWFIIFLVACWCGLVVIWQVQGPDDGKPLDPRKDACVDWYRARVNTDPKMYFSDYVGVLDPVNGLAYPNPKMPLGRFSFEGRLCQKLLREAAKWEEGDDPQSNMGLVWADQDGYFYLTVLVLDKKDPPVVCGATDGLKVFDSEEAIGAALPGNS